MGERAKKGGKGPTTAPGPDYEVVEALPVDHAAERAVLGAVLLSNDAYFEAGACGLVVDDFSLDSNRRLWRAIAALMTAQKPVDMITLLDQLRAQKELQAVGGVSYISSLTDGLSTKENVGHHAEILREKRLRRDVVYLSNRAMLQALDPGEPVNWTLEAIASDSLNLRGDSGRKRGEFVKEFTRDIVDELERRMYEGREIIGLPFGIQDLDDRTTGIREGELIILGGFTGSGKTAFAGTVVLNIIQQGIPVAFFSVEMKREAVAMRLLSQLSGISHCRLRRPQDLTKQDIRDLRDWKVKFDAMPLIIDDDGMITPVELEARARLYIAKHDVKLIVVDYLQLMNVPQKEKEYDQVSFVADTLVRLAKRTNVPVLALSQLSRPSDKRENPHPHIGLLRASGKIEQHAHVVLFTHRPMDDQNEGTGEDEILIGKQRAGATGIVKAIYDTRILRWEGRAVKSEAEQQELNLKTNGKGKTKAAAAGQEAPA